MESIKSNIELVNFILKAHFYENLFLILVQQITVNRFIIIYQDHKIEIELLPFILNDVKLLVENSIKCYKELRKVIG